MDSKIEVRYKSAVGCMFMMQLIKVGGKDYFLGSSADGYLFLYRIESKTLNDKPIS